MKKDELKLLKDIFDQGNRIFRIPDYQRGYSWESEQRSDLLKDIQYLIQGGYNYRHYTGTIVASPNQKYSLELGKPTYDIVDGQQRMTTLVLLLSVICRKLRAPNVQSKYNPLDIFSNYLIEGWGSGSSVRKFYSGSEQDKLFESLIIDGFTEDIEIKAKSDQNLTYAVKEFENWIDKSDFALDDVLKCILEHLGFLYYAPQNDAEIGIMFEVINNRGKALSQLEKIKNYLIYYAEKNGKSDIKRRVNDYWPDILSNLNKINYTTNDDEDRFLRNAYIVFMDTHKSKSYYVYDNLKEIWPPDGSRDEPEVMLRFIQFLKAAAHSYVKFYKGEGVSQKEVKWLKRISLHPANASVTPLILAIFSRFSDEQERTELFELIEKLNFRFYGTGIAGRSDSGQGNLFWVAWMVFNKWQQVDDWGGTVNFEWLKTVLINFVDERANDKSFVQYLTLDKDEAGDYYHWSGLKFFLASYEEYLREEVKESFDISRALTPRNPESPNDFFHKEHIWAVSDFEVINDSKDRDVNKRRLGNFLLLKEIQNIKVSNHSPEIKVEEYWADRKNDPNTLMIRELKQWFNDAWDSEWVENKWSRRTWRFKYNVYQRFLDTREEKMINFALKRWKVEGLNKIASDVKLDSFGSQNEIYSIKYQEKMDMEIS
ncbi:MAG: DUF262 domain-containing protein [Bacteroidia bacterium]|nr:DUF262 domain-containing protein [Bacteroidia bacterium]